MPTRMEEIAARSAQSGDEYRANKAENDRLADSYRKERKASTSKRKAAVVAMTPHVYLGRMGGGSAEKAGGGGVAAGLAKSAAPILKLVPKPVVYIDKPDDLADYSLPPASTVIPYEITPHAGSLVGIIPLLGSLLVYAGKQLLVSLAMTGLEAAIAAPIFQKAQRNSNVAIRYKTGHAGKVGSQRVEPRPAMSPGPRVPVTKTLGNTSSFEEWTGDFLGVGRGD